MRDEHDALALLAQLSHALEQALCFRLRERAGGLVEDEHPRGLVQSARDLDQLSLGQSETFHALVGVHADADLLEDVPRFIESAGSEPGRGEASPLAQEQVVDHRKGWDQ